ncbi:hypothetical protein ACWGNN_43465 [Streptomyces sp. NPDC055817]
MAAATAQVVRLFRRAHLQPPAEVEPLHGFLSPRLHEAVQIWRESGLPSPDDALRVLTDPDIEPVLLHGDAVGFNLLRSGDELALIDPAGVCGPAEFDAARWVARSLAVTGPGALDALTEVALSADPLLQRPRFDACERTGGYMDTLDQLICQTAQQSIEDGTEAITEEGLNDMLVGRQDSEDDWA